MELAPLGIQKDGAFRFNVPAELKKSKDGKIWVEGVASVETPDLANETVILNGMDLSYFTRRGFFNDNHDKTTGGKIGVPTEAKIVREGPVSKLHVKGYLLDTPRAAQVVQVADALKGAGGDRRLGFSVEGKVLHRDGKIIAKSWLKDIAITAEPYHPDSYCDIVKSISGMIAEFGVTEDEETKELRSLAKIRDAVSQEVRSQLDEFRKSLPVLTKTLSTETGEALRKEDLEGGLKNQDLPQVEPEEKEKEKEDEDDDEEKGLDKPKKLSKSQIVEKIMARGYSQAAAEKVANTLLQPKIRAKLVNGGKDHGKPE